MRRSHSLVLLVCLIWMGACGSEPPTPTPARILPVLPTSTPTFEAGPLNVAWTDRSSFRPGLVVAEQAVLGQLDGASFYQMDLDLAEDLLSLDGQMQVLYTNQELQPLNEVYFRLYPNLLGGRLTTQSVKVDAQGVEPALEQADSALRIPLAQPLPPGSRVVLDVQFAVQVPSDASGNYGVFGLADNVLALAHFYPIIPAFDDEDGWNIEIPTPQGDVVYADSSFYLVRVRAPVGLTLLASGVEVKRQDAVEVQEVSFAAGPMRDFYLAGSTDWVVLQQQAGETRVNSYAPVEWSDGAQRALDSAVRALEAFGQRFGAYPFTELDLLATPTSALGVEYPGATALNVLLYDPASARFPPAYLESTVAHEVAHQWFYSVVGNDQLDHPWLDEALAQYATLLYYSDAQGTEGAKGFRDSLEQRWARVNNADIPIGKPVEQYVGLEYGAIVYGRGPLFIEALGQTMGQEAFDAFLRDYYLTFKWGIATPIGFQELAESHCLCELDELFAQWVQ
jgi:hypothetical protein